MGTLGSAMAEAPLSLGPWKYDLQDQMFRSMLFDGMSDRVTGIVEMVLKERAQEGRWVNGSDVRAAVELAREVVRLADN